MSKAKRQMSGQPGRVGGARGKTADERISDDACGPPREHQGTQGGKANVRHRWPAGGGADKREPAQGVSRPTMLRQAWC